MYMWIRSVRLYLKQENDLNTYNNRAFYALKELSFFLVKTKTETGIKVGRRRSNISAKNASRYLCSYCGRSKPIPLLSGLFNLQ